MRVAFVLCYILGLLSAPDPLVAQTGKSDSTLVCTKCAVRVDSTKDSTSVTTNVPVTSARVTVRITTTYVDSFIAGSTTPPTPPVDSGTTPPKPPTNVTVLWSNNFSSGSGGLTFWGSPLPNVKNGVLQIPWTKGENNKGAAQSFATQQAVSVRFRYQAPAGANQGGIMKLIRFRGPNDRAIGTINVQWGGFLFFGDDFGDADNHYASGGPTPSACVAKWCTVEGYLAFTGGKRHVQFWVNGQLVIDYTDAKTIPYSNGIATIYFTGVFNDPGDARTDQIDDASIATGPQGT